MVAHERPPRWYLELWHGFANAFSAMLAVLAGMVRLYIHGLGNNQLFSAQGKPGRPAIDFIGVSRTDFSGVFCPAPA